MIIEETYVIVKNGMNGRQFADYNFYFYILFRIWAFFPCCEQKLDIINFV